jgi:hypothetical protein
MRDWSSMLLHNLGGLFTGDALSPTADVAALGVRDGVIVAADGADDSERFDAAGGWLMPGLWDGMQNLYFGDHTPTLSATGALAASVGFGVTDVVAVHPPAVPGATAAARFQRELAVLAIKSWGVERPGNLHVHTGTVIAHPSWDADDLHDLAACGADLLLLPASLVPDDSLRLAKTARDAGFRIGLLIDSATPSIDATALDEVLVEVRPELATPVNAPGLSAATVDRLIEADGCALGLVLAGDLTVAARVASACAEQGQPTRPFLGTGLPDDRGVLPAGLPLLIDLLETMTGLERGLIVAMASGNVARAFGRPGGVLAQGQPADAVALTTPSTWLRPSLATFIDGRPILNERQG